MNLKKIYFFLLSISCTTNLLAQAAEEPLQPVSEKNKYSSFQLGISFGFSFSNGNYSESDSNTESAAFAEKNGSSFNIFELTYQIRPKLLVKAYYLQSRHDVATEKLAEDLAEPNFSYQVFSSGYELKAAVGGVGFQLPGENASISLFFLLAYGNTFVPSFEIAQTDANGNTQDFNFQAQDENSFGFGVNPVLSIHLNDRLNFNAQLSYLIFESEFAPIRINQSKTANPFARNTEKYGYEALNVNFGFSYRL